MGGAGADTAFLRPERPPKAPLTQQEARALALSPHGDRGALVTLCLGLPAWKGGHHAHGGFPEGPWGYLLWTGGSPAGTPPLPAVRNLFLPAPTASLVAITAVPPRLCCGHREARESPWVERKGWLPGFLRDPACVEPGLSSHVERGVNKPVGCLGLRGAGRLAKHGRGTGRRWFASPASGAQAAGGGPGSTRPGRAEEVLARPSQERLPTARILEGR